MDRPLISVIIPTYNQERFVAEAIRSVLQQNYPPLEIIVVNDGSTDSTQKILETFGDDIIVIQQKNQGQSVARNVGVQSSKGTIIGMLDSDDIWPDTHIQDLLPHVTGQNSADIARGMTQYVKYLNTPQEDWTPPALQVALVGSCLCKRSLFDRVGWFDPDMRQGQDLDWAARIIESGVTEKAIPQTTLWYRRHENNLTNDLTRVQKGQTDTLRKKIERKKNSVYPTQQNES